MAAFVLHIGHHKTASSLLQRRLFPHLERTAFFLKREIAASRAIVNAFGASPALWREQGDSWLAGLREEADRRHPGGVDRLLVSAEGMSAHKLFSRGYLSHGGGRRDPWRMAGHLREAAAVAARAGLKLQVLLLFRRQDQYLASRFASIGRHVGALSQANFEAQVQEILDPDRRWCDDGIWLDHALIRDLICEAIGAEALLMLPYELLAGDPAAFLQRLTAFLQTPVALDPGTLAVRENARALGTGSWKLQRGRAGAALEKLLARCPANLLPALPPNRLQLTPDLQQRILARCSASNRRLAADLGLDLAAYGYLPPD